MGEDTLGWAQLAAALAAFLLSHSLPARPAIRAWLVGRIGKRAYLAAYSLLSLLMLAWLVSAAGNAPYVELWPRADWQTFVPVLAMPFACLLLVDGFSRATPLSLGGRRNVPFDPRRPALAGLRHPVLWAALLWSASHLLPNGDLAHVLMFGMFAALAVGGMVLFDRRRQHILGPGAWRALARNTSNLPFAAPRGDRLPTDWRALLGRVAAAVALYLVLFATHGLFAGMPVSWN